MHGIEWASEAIGVVPHAEADRVTRHREALPESLRQEGEGLENVTPGGEVQRGVLLQSSLPPCREEREVRSSSGSCIRPPHSLQCHCVTRPHSRFITAGDKIFAQSTRICFRTADRGWVTLNELRDVHSFLKSTGIPTCRESGTM